MLSEIRESAWDGMTTAENKPNSIHDLCTCNVIPLVT